MSSRMLELAIAIKGTVDGSFTGSIANASKMASQMSSKIKDLNKELRDAQRAGAAEMKASGAVSSATQEHIVSLQRELNGLTAQRATLQNAIAAKEQAMARVSSAAAGVRSAMMYTAVAAAPLVGAIKVAADFEAGMSKVGAITRASAEDMQKLTAQARELGETTQFTARQAADAMSYLGMAGWNTEQIMAGMPGLLALSAASGTDLARVADIVSDDLTAFGLSADQAQHMADVFAVTITRTNTNVEMLGDTMKYAAPVAKAFGASMEETSALAGLMAGNGIKASQAGTALRSGLLRLAGPPKQAAKALDDLGISMSDVSAQQAEAQAAMRALGISFENTDGPRKMSAILEELRGKMAGLGREEKLANLKMIFGTEAATAWLAVIDSGPEAFNDLVTAMENSDGEAAQMAETMNNNARGAAVRLSSAIESIGISIGSAFLPEVAAAADAVAKMAGGLSKWASEHPRLITGVTTLAAAIAGLYLYIKITTLASALWKAATVSMNSMLLAQKAYAIAHGVALNGMSISMRLAAAAQWAFNTAMTANPVGLVIAGIAALIAIGYALYSNWDTIKQFFVELWESPAGAVLAFATGPIGWLIYTATAIIQNWDAVKQWFVLLWNDPRAAINSFVDYLMGKFNNLINWISDKWQGLKEVLSSPISSAVNFVTGGGDVAHNAAGGLYGKGAFLTTFAENSPEAAIPIDGSNRAKSLWARTGEMLGVSTAGSGSFSMSFNPTITIQGGADADTVGQMNSALQDLKEQMQAEFERRFNAMQQRGRRLSYE